jgi:hypothetical protein
MHAILVVSDKHDFPTENHLTFIASFYQIHFRCFNQCEAVALCRHRAGFSPAMSPSTIRQLRAHLVLASLAAALIQVLVLIAMLVFRVPARIFMVPSLRLGMLAAIVCIVLFIRGRSRAAFMSAVASGHVIVNGWQRGVISISPQCPRRLLVVFYLRLNSRLFDRTVP